MTEEIPSPTLTAGSSSSFIPLDNWKLSRIMESTLKRIGSYATFLTDTNLTAKIAYSCYNEESFLFIYYLFLFTSSIFVFNWI